MTAYPQEKEFGTLGGKKKKSSGRSSRRLINNVIVLSWFTLSSLPVTLGGGAGTGGALNVMRLPSTSISSLHLPFPPFTSLLFPPILLSSLPSICSFLFPSSSFPYFFLSSPPSSSFLLSPSSFLLPSLLFPFSFILFFLLLFPSFPSFPSRCGCPAAER